MAKYKAGDPVEVRRGDASFAGVVESVTSRKVTVRCGEKLVGFSVSTGAEWGVSSWRCACIAPWGRDAERRVRATEERRLASDLRARLTHLCVGAPNERLALAVAALEETNG